MKKTCIYVVGLLAASMAYAQSPSDLQWPTIALAAPGSANLAPVLLTSLPVGFSQDTIATFSQRCSLTPPTTGTGTTQVAPQVICDVGSGNPRTLLRQGTLLTRTGDTLLGNEQAFTQGTAAIGTITAGIDLLQDNVVTTQPPAIQNLLRLDTPELSCTTSANVATRTERSIIGFAFNEPLNVLYVVTLNSKTYYSVDPQRADALACSVPMGAVVPFVQDTTRTLIRVKGFNAAAPVPAGN